MSIDKELVLQRLKGGETPADIAKDMNCTRQAISRYKVIFIYNGKLSPNSSSRSAPMRKPTQVIDVDIDRQIELLISALQALKNEPLKDAAIKEKDNIIAALRDENRQLRDNQDKRDDQERRYRLARQQVDVGTG